MKSKEGKGDQRDHIGRGVRIHCVADVAEQIYAHQG